MFIRIYQDRHRLSADPHTSYEVDPCSFVHAWVSIIRFNLISLAPYVTMPGKSYTYFRMLLQLQKYNLKVKYQPGAEVFGDK